MARPRNLFQAWVPGEDGAERPVWNGVLSVVIPVLDDGGIWANQVKLWPGILKVFLETHEEWFEDTGFVVSWTYFICSY